MNTEAEKFLRQFDREFRLNPSLRIEEKFDDAVSESWSREDRLEFWRQLILLETDLRYEFRQPLNKADYERRFQQVPEYLDFIDEAFRRIDNLRVESESAQVMEVTWTFQGSTNQAGELVFGPGSSSDDGPIFIGDGNDDIPNELGRFKDIQKIGQGGFGIVCRAWDSEAEEYRALKFPTRLADRNGDFLTEVQQETNKSIGIDHPNIVKTFGMEIIEPYVFVVQEFVDGGDLKAWMKKEHSIDEKVEMVARIAAGLQHVHSVPYEITHCDIKPANILVESNGNPKIGDFGLAFHEKDRLGQPAMIVGTPAYLAPMVAEGYIRQADGRADLFSLGVIFYEMLAGRKPFGGSDTNETILEIINRDPTPIRNINPRVTEELELICLRCLAKKTLDRYQLASDLIQDLSDLGKGPPPVPVRRIVPRGIRSFTEDDNDFFLDLLPGVRDRENIPVSISFWLKRIVEPVSDSERIPNGFLFGPSGSGKSSFVKAGLIPEIKKKADGGQVTTIYVESTRDDTEVRILNSLRKQFPEIPRDKKLSAVFAGLANGKWRGELGATKILLVIDQFEQWISKYDPGQKEQLIKALKHCDGEHLQTLMLVRDDFFLASLRFTDALDINLQEDENFKNIDLFDEAHAKKVLFKLWQAYDERIPWDQSWLVDSQIDFLDQTVSQLSRNHFVVCVRLTLFAEMFKNRSWTIEELNSVGGVAGVGEQFLESTFGEDTTSVEFRGPRRQIVQSILEELLPDQGSNIRGTMKTREELLAAAKCENREKIFDQIIHKLHRDLTLITRTDPDASGETSVTDETTPSGLEYYQLTHDYLVPSIRNWLNTKLRNSRRGRAIIRLRELAAQVVPGQKPKYLPGNWEWLYWQFAIRDQVKTENEQKVFRSAKFRFQGMIIRTAIVLVLILSVGFWLTHRLAGIELAKDLFEKPYPDLPSVVRELDSYKSVVMSQLGQMEGEEADLDADKRLRLSLGRLQYEASELERIKEAVTNAKTSPEKLKSAVEIVRLAKLDDQLVKYLVETMADVGLPTACRFRAGIGLCLLGDESTRWAEVAGSLASGLIEEPRPYQESWIQILSLNGKSFSSKFLQMFAESNDSDTTQVLATALFHFMEVQEFEDAAVESLADCNEFQFAAMLATIENANLGESLKKKLEERANSEQIDRRVSKLAIALARLGSRERFLKQIGQGSALGQRNYLIVLSTIRRIPTELIFDMLPENSEAEDSNVVLTRQALLLILAQQLHEINDDQVLASIERIAKETCLSDKNASCFSAGELILKRLQVKAIKNDLVSLRRERTKKIGNGRRAGEVFFNSQGTAFSIVKIKDEKGDYLLAVSTEESTSMEINSSSTEDPGSTLPININDFYAVFEFCNSLSREEKIEPFYSRKKTKGENQRRFLEQMKLDFASEGYRLPTMSESFQMGWVEEYDSRFGKDLELANEFAQIYSNTDGAPTHVATRIPNPLGIFDLFGNAQETAMLLESQPEGNYRLNKILRFGGSARLKAEYLISKPRTISQLEKFPASYFSMRLVKRISN